MIEAVFALVLGADDCVASDALLRKINQLEIRLFPEEKLLLKLCYQDGLGVHRRANCLE